MTRLDVYAAAARWPRVAALETPNEAITYLELARRVQDTWCALQGDHGPFDPGLPVAWHAEPTLASLSVFYALVTHGIPVLPLHPRLTTAEHAAQMTMVQPQAIVDAAFVANPTIRPRHEELAPPGADDREVPLAILFTSGSTTPGGRPVVLSRGAFVASAAASAQRLGWLERDRWLLTLPLAHVGGISVLTRCLLAGKTVVLPEPGARPESVLAVGRLRGASLTSLVPTQVRGWLESMDRDPWPALRAVLVGGAGIDQALHEAAIARKLPLLKTYGMTEACSQVATQPPGSWGRTSSDCGSPLPGYQVRARDGILEVRSPSLFTGYWPNQSAPLEAGGWWRTQDHGWLDEGGLVHVAGRADGIIISGGENVSLAEVEAAMVSCEGVRQVCALGIPDPHWGELVALLVEPQPGCEVTGTQLTAHAQRTLGKHKRPRRWSTTRSMLLTANGKLDRARIRAIPWDWRVLDYRHPARQQE